MEKLWYVFIHIDGGAIVSDRCLTKDEANKVIEKSMVSMDLWEYGLDYAFSRTFFIACYGFGDKQKAEEFSEKMNG